MGEWDFLKYPRKGGWRKWSQKREREERGDGWRKVFWWRKEILLINTDFVNAFPQRQFEAMGRGQNPKFFPTMVEYLFKNHRMLILLWLESSSWKIAFTNVSIYWMSYTSKIFGLKKGWTVRQKGELARKAKWFSILKSLTYNTYCSTKWNVYHTCVALLVEKIYASCN